MLVFVSLKSAGYTIRRELSWACWCFPQQWATDGSQECWDIDPCGHGVACGGLWQPQPMANYFWLPTGLFISWGGCPGKYPWGMLWPEPILEGQRIIKWFVTRYNACTYTYNIVTYIYLHYMHPHIYLWNTVPIKGRTHLLLETSICKIILVGSGMNEKE